MAKHPDEPERGSREHAIETTLRNYRHDLKQITDRSVHGATIDAIVKRIDAYDKETELIAKDLGPRIRELEARYDPLPKEDPERRRLEKQLVAIDRQWDRRQHPLSKVLHKDLDDIVAKAVAPFVERQRAFVKRVDAVGKSLRARELAEQFKAREKSQRQPGKDRDRGR